MTDETDETDDPRRILDLEFKLAAAAQRKKAESQASASRIRMTRVTNGLDVLLARLLEAR